MTTKLNEKIILSLETLAHEIRLYQSFQLMNREGSEEALMLLKLLKRTMDASVSSATDQWNHDINKIKIWKESTK